MTEGFDEYIVVSDRFGQAKAVLRYTGSSPCCSECKFQVCFGKQVHNYQVVARRSKRSRVFRLGKIVKLCHNSLMEGAEWETTYDQHEAVGTEQIAPVLLQMDKIYRRFSMKGCGNG